MRDTDVEARIRRMKAVSAVSSAAYRKSPHGKSVRKVARKKWLKTAKGKAYLAAKEARRVRKRRELADTQVQIRMPSRMHDKLRKRAYDERRSIGSIIRVLVEDGLKRGADA